MADLISLKVAGDKKTLKAFRKLDLKVQKKAVRKGTRAGAKLVLADAKRLAPSDSRELIRSAKVRALKRSRRAQGHRVLFEAEHSFHVETGTSDTAAQPFLRPALDKNVGAVERAVGVEVRKAIQEARA